MRGSSGQRGRWLCLLLAACASPIRENEPSASGSARSPSAVAVAVPSATSASPVVTASAAVSASDPDSPPARPPRAGACSDDGLLAKGALRTSKLDVHSYARLLGTLFKKDVIVGGDLASPKLTPCAGDCLDLEDRASDFEQAFALSGAPLTVRRGAALVSFRTLASASKVLGPSPDVDLSFARIDSADLVKLLGDASKREIEGMPDGELSTLVRRRPALDTLALIADVAGTTLSARGNDVVVDPGGALPGAKPSPQKLRTPDPGDRQAAAGSEDVSSLRVAALVRGPQGDPLAVLHSRARGLTWVVRGGDFVGKPQQLPRGDATMSLRVSRIHCLGVEFSFGERKTDAWLFLE
jgi:hypothetical protein